jgi:UDPglucose--hexose-1-phosphate uridylyltransferase
MSQLRLNPLTGRWVTVSSARSNRPSAWASRSLAVEADHSRPCPFCPGNEEATPPALETYGPSGAWQVRVMPNLFPAFSGSDPLTVSNLGPVFTQAEASGIHEVFVFSPDHNGSWADLDDASTALAMFALRDRFAAHTQSGAVRYSQAIVNFGREAGASLEHPHGQLLGLPFVPKDIADEENGFARFAGGCVLCATNEAEASVRHRVVHEDDRALVVCPFWSGEPFELLVIPKTHASHLDQVQDDDLASVGRALRTSLGMLRHVVGDVAYNIVLHSSPHHHHGGFHWHVHVLPKLTTRAGFELGTGVLINIVAPEEAASQLRGARVESGTG